MIKSSKFSFVRFEHPHTTDVSLDIPYTLPVFEEHNTAFHFIVDVDRPVDEAIKLGVADTSGKLINAFNPVILAIPMSYRFRLAGLLNYNTFELMRIKLGGIEKLYDNLFVTYDEFKALLDEDFGLELVEDYFVVESPLPFQIDAYYPSSVQPNHITLFPLNENIPYWWHEGYISVENIPVLQSGCFTYALLNEDNTLLGYSNGFRVVDEDAFTSQFNYKCVDSSFEFVYSFAGVNMIRLPVYLTKPDWPSKRIVNRQSDGRTTMLSALMEKQYVIETDHMPEVFHECLRAALLHDSLIIKNSNIREVTVEVLEAENYTVAWNDDLKLSYAPGKGTVKVASFGYSNSNC